MKKVKKLLPLFIITCFVAICYGHQKSAQTNLDSLLLMNIDALASGEEGELGKYICYGEGTVDCPNGDKVEYYFNNLRLDLE